VLSFSTKDPAQEHPRPAVHCDAPWLRQRQWHFEGNWYIRFISRPFQHIPDGTQPRLPAIVTDLSWGELDAEFPVAIDDIPGSCAAKDFSVDVELGREMGSRVAGGSGRVAACISFSSIVSQGEANLAYEDRYP